MMKRLAFLFIILTIFFVGCGTSNNDGISSGGSNQEPANNDIKANEPNMIGYVVDKEGERILVVDPEPMDFSSTGGVSEYYDAIMFSNVPNDIEIGEKVK